MRKSTRWSWIALMAMAMACHGPADGGGEPEGDPVGFSYERPPTRQLPIERRRGNGQAGAGGLFCDFGPAGDRHVLDGEFSKHGDERCPSGEWDHVTPVAGRYGNVYFDMTQWGLYLLNDWHLNQEEPTDPDCYNRFNFVIGQVDQWEIRVFGSGFVEAWRNGELQQDGVDGAAGFGPSPLTPEDHAIYELKIPAPPPDTGWLMQACDPPGPATVPTWSPPPPSTPPRATSSCDSELATEPTIYEGKTGPEGSDGPLEVRGVTEPRITGTGGPPRPGASWLVIGAHLDRADPLQAWIAGTHVRLLERSATHIRVAVPPLSALPDGPLGVRLRVGDTWTNSLTFARPGPECVRECGGRTCGDDGCGGTCGTCAADGFDCWQGRCRDMGPPGCYLDADCPVGQCIPVADDWRTCTCLSDEDCLVDKGFSCAEFHPDSFADACIPTARLR